ncbi:hypothetical protein P153DRAFT_381335 [Dothidotthia symphoricarpi CBS 119687]|uniref:Uncharacterized protein n=1 Tax=Dothidotthia symphoricarpi CBS 119687 TaxID=1392245 RepID=A0A6A6AT70_9PLEO|nr:uncharacterized protein P153DRAFT_381335 [Dothidotthia symphoricarpi CBS 119687]KAF2134154.1 hypothetical protein P153DRAFT_381335 [Dothidotthia symphoricarpi CBS 119687]
MSCPFEPDFEIAPNVTFSAFEKTREECPKTYLRSASGGSMMPWLLVLFLLLFHLPSCIIRAVRWESAQYLALGLAVLAIAFTVQAYQSTALKPSEVLVWMPLTLVLDAGAMLQMVVLIIEKHDGGVRELWAAVQHMLSSAKHAVLVGLFSSKRAERTPNETQETTDPLLVTSDPNHQETRSATQNISDVEAQASLPPFAEKQQTPAPGTLRYAIVAFFAFIFLLTLVVLQLYGLHAAVVGRRQKDFSVFWCSPSFRDFAVAITTGNCERYIVVDSINGIGCISLPASQQSDWLLGTIIALVTALICQLLDTVLLKCTDSETRYRGVKVQRPWLTMFGGMVMLIILITTGVFNASRLPTGVTEKVWIYRKEPSKAVGRVCHGIITAPGLRGMLIGYLDGLFESWGTVYYGK